MNNNKVHICFILSVPLFPLKAGSFNCYRRARALRNQGFRVTILTSRIQDPRWAQFRASTDLNGIKVLDCLPAKVGPRFFRHLTPLLFSWPLITITLRKERPDILHVINPPDVIPMIVSVVNRFLRIPYVFHMADPGPESVLSLTDLNSTKKSILLAVSKFMENIVIRQAKGMITVNEILRKRILATRKHLNNKPFIVQYNVSSLKPNNQNPGGLAGEKYILYVGTLSTGMLGLESLINYFAPIWHKYRAKLFIIGDGPLKTRLSRVIQSTRAEEYVSLLGYMKPEYIPEYVRNASLCVIPYLDTVLTRIATPTKLFEYISMGKAVVYPDFPGFTEILGNTNPGMYHSGISGDAIRVIDSLLKDDEIRKKTEEINRQIFCKFEYDSEIDKIVELYRRVLNENPRSK